MPKFELVIDPPPYIRDLNSCEQATVRARSVARNRTIQRVKLKKQAGTSVQHTAPLSTSCRYTFGKPVTGKLTVNMTVNGVGYYRHEMGHPVIKTMEV